MKRKLFGILSCCAAFVATIFMPLPVSAMQETSKVPTPTPGQQIFNVVPTLDKVAATHQFSTLGVALWVIVATLLFAALVFMIINIVRYRKAEIIRLQSIKPTLIISEGYTKTKKI